MAGGRPSPYDKLDLDQVRKLAEDGWTDKKMARFFGVTEQTWNNWKKAHPEFFESLKTSKQFSDNEVEKSLYKRALGFTGPDDKFYPPDNTSAIFWLKNRKPEQWRDKKEIQANVTMNHEDALKELE